MALGLKQRAELTGVDRNFWDQRSERLIRELQRSYEASASPGNIDQLGERMGILLEEQIQLMVYWSF